MITRLAMRKLASILCTFLCLMLVLSACGTASPAESTTSSTTLPETTTVVSTVDPALIPLCQDGKALYRVIRDEDASQEEIDLSVALYEYLNAQSDIKFTIDTDWYKRGGDPDAMFDYEILIGNTSRSASAEAMEGGDLHSWCVSLIGTRIVIGGASPALLAEAIEHFKSLCTVVDGVLMFDSKGCKIESEPDPLSGKNLTLRIGSFNIKNGSGVNHKMEILAKEITALNLDIVGLQEVDIGTSRAQGLDTLKLLAEAAGYPYYQFTRSIDFGGGEYGTAIMSRYPIVSYETVSLNTPSGYEARTCGHATIDVNGTPLHFFNTHLSYENRQLRDDQFAQIAQIALPQYGYIITGDFNTQDMTEFHVFDGATFTNEGQYATFPSSSSAIDNIVLAPDWKIVSSGMATTLYSDHNPLWAEIHYEK